MKTLKLEFVEFVPQDVEDGIIFISMQYRTAVHNCACGCREKVVTRFSPNDWRLTFDGISVTLYPSIGNWNFPCKSHYFICNNQIINIPTWLSKPEINKRPTSKLKKVLKKRRKE